MEASSLSLLTLFPLGIPLGPLLIILQKARSCVPFTSESSLASQDCCLKDTNVEFCSQREAMLTSHTTLYKDTLLGSSFQNTNHSRFLFSSGHYYSVVPVLAVSLPLTLGFSAAGLSSYFLIFDTLSFSICHPDIFIGISYFFFS